MRRIDELLHLQLDDIDLDARLIMQKTYAHLAPEAWHQDYHRLAFHMPTEPARVVEIVRDHRGRLAGRRSITVDARETADPGARQSA